MNDWLDYKGSGSSRAYSNDILMHPGEYTKRYALNNVEYKQRKAYYELGEALIEKAYKKLDELKAAQEYVTKIDDAIHQKTNEDKNYNTNGLLQRKKAYLVRRSAANNELEKTINEIMNTYKKMSIEIGYNPLELRGMGDDPERDVKMKIDDIKSKQKTILNMRSV